MTTIGDASAQQARVLRLTINRVEADFNEQLRTIIEPFRGGATTIRIVLNNSVGHAELELGPEWRVRGEPALCQAIEAMDGVIEAELRYR